MNWQAGLVRAVFLTAAISASGSVVAAQCYERSPALEKEGDAYYDLEFKAELTRDQEKALEKLTSRVEGDWIGSGSEFFCKGSENNPRPETKRFQSRLAISAPARHQLRLEEQRHVESTGTRMKNVANPLGKMANARVLEVGDRRLLVTEKYRRVIKRQAGGAGPTSVNANLWEVVHDVRLEGDRLNYITTRYVNGYLSSQDSGSYLRGR